MADAPSSTPLPMDLLPVRDAARLVDRGVSTLRGWVRDGALAGYREDPAHPENSRLLVSREAVLRLVVEAGKASAPGRRPTAPVSTADDLDPPAPAAASDAERAAQRAALAELRADLRAALAERDGARAALEATGRTVAALEARCADLAALADAERRRTGDVLDRLTAAEAERDALREWHGLPLVPAPAGAPLDPEAPVGCWRRIAGVEHPRPSVSTRARQRVLTDAGACWTGGEHPRA